MTANTFFVLGGLVNGEEGCPALPAGDPTTTRPMPDGWYFFREDGDVGPHKSREAARRAQARYTKVRSPGLRLLGHTFLPMTPQDLESFAGAGDGSMICHCDDGTTLVFDPTRNDLTEVLEPDTDLAITDADEEERCWTFQVVR